MASLGPVNDDVWFEEEDLLPNAAKMGDLDRRDIDRLFEHEKVRLLIKDRGSRYRQIDAGNSLQFWQAYARNHTVNPGQKYIAASSMSGEIAYRASEWYDGRGAAVVLLEILR